MGVLTVTDKLYAHLQQILSLCEPAPLLLGYSGGVDSHLLLCLLNRFVREHTGFTLQAVHVHHGLNPKADSWARHCEATCAELGVPLLLERLSIHRAPRQSLEAVARDLRYQAMAAHLVSGGYLVTAHHQDDQLETLLLALKRGSGPRGLSAMQVSQPFASGVLLRPLLGISRAEILAWASSHGLQWIEDDSNQDSRFDRNYLRAEIVPRLQQRWPEFAAMASRSSQLCGEQEQLCEELAHSDLEAVCHPDGSLTLEGLCRLSTLRRQNLLRHWLRRELALVPGFDLLQRIWLEVISARPDATPELKCGTAWIRRHAHRLYLVPPLPALPTEPLAITLDGESGGFYLSDGRHLRWHRGAGGLRKPLAHETVTLRFACRGGERIRIAGRSGSRSLKKLWQECEVAPWLRERVPLIYYGEQLVQAVGYFCAADAVESHDGVIISVG